MLLQVWMLTGDNRRAAHEVCHRTGDVNNGLVHTVDHLFDEAVRGFT